MDRKAQYGFLSNGEPRRMLPTGFWENTEWNPDPDPAPRELKIKTVTIKDLADYLCDEEKNIIVTPGGVNVWFSGNPYGIPGVYKIGRHVRIQHTIAMQMKERIDTAPELILTMPNGEEQPGDETADGTRLSRLSERFREHKKSNRESFKRITRALNSLQSEIRFDNRSVDGLELRLSAIENWLKQEFGFRPAEPVEIEADTVYTESNQE